MKLSFGILLSLFLAQFAWTQELPEVSNSDSYQEPRSYSDEKGRLFNEAEFYTHPDFGKLTFQAPYEKNVVEDISKRTEYERYYVDINHPAYFYIEKSSKRINLEVDGYLRAIDPSMHKLNQAIYLSGFQPYRTGFDAINQRTTMSFGEHFIEFNQTKLKIVHLDNSIEIIEPNWSNYEMTNFKGYITDIFPSVDMKLQFFEGRVKSEFIIKQNLNVKELIFIDELNLSEDLELLLSDENPFNLNFLEIYNTESGLTEVVTQPAACFDNSANRISWLSEYQLIGNDLNIVVDSAHLNNPSLIYPLIIDPTFIAVGPVVSGGVGGVHGSVQVPGTCTDNIVLTFPGGSEPWDTQVGWTVYTQECAGTLLTTGFTDPCWRSDARIWIDGCGNTSPAAAPVVVWTCGVPACDAPGFWVPTIPFSGDGMQSLIDCYPTQCPDQIMTFTINTARGYCAPYTFYDNCTWADSYCVSLDDWNVTVQGRSVETLSNTVTGSGNQNIYDADCAGTQTLNPTPLYGVPGYTYSWSNGASTPTITVPGTVSTFTADVTDACGNTVTATFDIGCPLATELEDFTAKLKQDNVHISWNTITEADLESFDIEKSNNGIDWRIFGTKKAEGGVNVKVNYSANDQAPQIGLNYYRLKINNVDGTSKYSDVEVVQLKNLFSMHPNPAKSSVILERLNESKGVFTFEITDLFGKRILIDSFESNSIEIDLSKIEGGTYIVNILNNGIKTESQKLVITH